MGRMIFDDGFLILDWGISRGAKVRKCESRDRADAGDSRGRAGKCEGED